MSSALVDYINAVELLYVNTKMYEYKGITPSELAHINFLERNHIKAFEQLEYMNVSATDINNALAASTYDLSEYYIHQD